MKNLLYVILSCLFIISLPINLFGRDINKDYHESYEVKPGDMLSLRHGDGNVFISTWDKDVVDIDVHFSASIFSLGDNEYKFEVTFEQRGNTIEVREHTRPDHYIGIRGLTIDQYKYIIQAPKYLILDLRGDDGDIDIRDITGNISCRLSDGDVTLNNITTKMLTLNMEDGSLKMNDIKAEMEIKIDDGDVNISDYEGESCTVDFGDGQFEMNRASGNFDLRGDDGDIELHRISAGTLKASTNDGDICVDLRKSKTPNIELKTDDGKVIMDFDATISTKIKIETDDGRIDTDLSNPEYERKKPSYYFSEVHGGQGQIHIRTNDGDVILREAG